jgi:hypothetical protein
MQSESHPFVESRMQVDEPEPADSPINPGSIIPKRPVVSIPEEAVQWVCKQLGRCIQPGDDDDDDDDSIRKNLESVWITVHSALSLEQRLRARLADRDEFQENVKKSGEKEFIELLRSMTKKKIWRDLLENSKIVRCV